MNIPTDHSRLGPEQRTFGHMLIRRIPDIYYGVYYGEIEFRASGTCMTVSYAIGEAKRLSYRISLYADRDREKLIANASVDFGDEWGEGVIVNTNHAIIPLDQTYEELMKAVHIVARICIYQVSPAMRRTMPDKTGAIVVRFGENIPDLVEKGTGTTLQKLIRNTNLLLG